jgi:hypothetical protein
MMEAANTSETPINFYQTTRCSVPEDSHLQFKPQFSEYIRDTKYNLDKSEYTEYEKQHTNMEIMMLWRYYS